LLLSLCKIANAETKAIDLLEQCLGTGPSPALHRAANIKLCRIEIQRFLDSLPVVCRWPDKITVEQLRFSYINVTQNQPRLLHEEAAYALKAALPISSSCN